MNEDAADALLKDLEEPPSYAVIVLVADDLGPIPETIRSRCQLVPFTRLSERAIREAVDARAPELDEAQRGRARAGRRRAASTGSRGCSTRRRRGGARRCSPRRAPSTATPAFEPADAAAALLESARERGAEARELEEVKVRGLELPAREAEQRVRRAQRGAEREELLAQLEELASWYRDLVVVGVGAEAAATHVDRLERAPRRRDPRAAARRRAGGRGGARHVAAARGVQPGAAARARGALRRARSRAGRQGCLARPEEGERPCGTRGSTPARSGAALRLGLRRV